MRRVQTEQQVDGRSVSVRVPRDVERGELERAHGDECKAERQADAHADAHAAQVVPLRGALRVRVGQQARDEDREIQRSEAQVGRQDVGRPRIEPRPDVHVRQDGEREPRASDRHHADRAPPHQAVVAERMVRQPGRVHGDRPVGVDDARVARHHGTRSRRTCLRVSLCRGQNQAISVIATGIEPHTTAHGVKIDEMNSTLVAIAASSGQIVGVGNASR